MMSRNEKVSIAAFGVVCAVYLLDALLYLRIQISSLPAVWPYLAWAGFSTLLVWGRYRLKRLAAEEARDVASAREAHEGSALFAAGETDLDPFSYQKARRQLERWFTPALAPLFALLAAYWGYQLFSALPSTVPSGHHLLVASFLIGQGFLLFLFGRYFLGLGRSSDARLLRGPGSFLVLACFASILTGIAAIVSDTGYTVADVIVRRALAIFLVLMSIEWILQTIAYMYRPKRKGDVVITYESRIAGLLTDPASWSSDLARAIDYQFGFQVSETWFYRFLRRALLPLILAQALLLYALSCVVVLGPEEAGLRERLGSPYGPDGKPRLIESGFHFKWPWPFERIHRHPVHRIQTTHIGFRKDPHDDRPRVMLWTVPHYLEEDQFIMASRDAEIAEEGMDAAVPVNLISVTVPIEYRITNLVQYAYQHADPDKTLRQIAYRTLTRDLVGRDLIDLLGEERSEARAALHAQIQAEAEFLQLGIEIIFTGLQGVHPPIPVADAFESVIGAMEEKETLTLTAQAYRNRILPMANAEADELLWMARSDRARRTDIAEAEADYFQTRLRLHRELPGIYTHRQYLDALARALREPRKYIVGVSPDHEVLWFNMEEKITPDLFDFGPGMREDLFL